MRVYHFLPQKWAFDDIEKKRLKISLIEDLNDPFELMGIDTSDLDVRQALQETRRELGSKNGVLCFSRSWSNPVLWSHYADKHKGIALGFEIPHSPESPILMEVCYVDSPPRHTVEELLAWGEPEMQRLLTTKFTHWKYEDEVRVFVSLEEKEADGRYYFTFSDNLILTNVILGVRCEAENAQIQRLICGFQKPVEIIRARLDSTSFSVGK